MPWGVDGDRAEPVTGERISALEGIGENVCLEHERGRGKGGKAPLDRELPGRESTTPFSPDREIEPAVSREKAPELEPAARGKGVEMDTGL